MPDLQNQCLLFCDWLEQTRTWIWKFCNTVDNTHAMFCLFFTSKIQIFFYVLSPWTPVTYWQPALFTLNIFDDIKIYFGWMIQLNIFVKKYLNIFCISSISLFLLKSIVGSRLSMEWASVKSIKKVRWSTLCILSWTTTVIATPSIPSSQTRRLWRWVS